MDLLPIEISDDDENEPDQEIIVQDAKQLLQMPDDCLKDICRYLRLADLSSFASSCTRLNGIARNAFSLKPANKHVDLKELLVLFGTNAGAIGMEKVELYFESFGGLLLEVRLDLMAMDAHRGLIDTAFTPMNVPIFNLIMRHCSGGALEALQLRGVEMQSHHSVEMQRLFGGVKKIRLHNCTMVYEALSASTGCKELHLCTDTFNEVHNLSFPKLESFTVDITGVGFSKNDFASKHNGNCTRFLRRHPNLKCLRMDISKQVLPKMDFINSLRDLEKLELTRKFGKLTLGEWDNLRELKTLRIDSESTDAIEFLQTSATAESLKHLSLRNPIINEDFFNGLSRFKKLCGLNLTGCHDMTNDGILSLDLPELTEFKLFGYTQLSADGVVEMVEKFQKLIEIALHSTGHTIDPDIYEKLIAVCRKQKKKLKISLFGAVNRSGDYNFDPNFVEVNYR